MFANQWKPRPFRASFWLFVAAALFVLAGIWFTEGFVMLHSGVPSLFGHSDRAVLAIGMTALGFGAAHNSMKNGLDMNVLDSFVWRVFWLIFVITFGLIGRAIVIGTVL